MIAGLVLVLGLLAPATALGKPGGTDRPIQGNGSGTTVLDLGTLTFVTDGTGTVSHLGKTTLHFDGVLTPTGPSTFTIAGPVTLTAANGDQLFGNTSGSGTLDGSGNARGTLVTTFTGGTGRFTRASGSSGGTFSQVLITTNGVTSTFATEFTLSGGTISY
ncbi:MAG: hypothetical protein WBZ00_05370 [Solirubrobacterales bacterium]|jgi:hypothetical protein